MPIFRREFETISRESESGIPRGELLTQDHCVKIRDIFINLLDPNSGTNVLTITSFNSQGAGKKQRDKWESIKKCVDYNGDGVISLEEFFAFFINYGLRETRKCVRRFDLKDLLIDRYTEFRTTVSRQIDAVEELMNE